MQSNTCEAIPWELRVRVTGVNNVTTDINTT